MLVRCEKTILYLKESEPLTKGSQNTFEMRFDFSSEWDGLSKTVVFCIDETKIAVVLDSGNRCMIPHEILSMTGMLYVGVYGTSTDCVLASLWYPVGKINPAVDGGEPSEEPTPSVYRQILELERQAVSAVDQLRADAENGEFNGADGITPTVGENGNWFLGDVDTGKPSCGRDGLHGERGERGYSGLFPKVSVPYAPAVTVAANVVTEIESTEGSLEILLGEAVEGYDNEWIFIITQQETVHDIILPIVSWTLGIAPIFAANSVTELRLHYKGDCLEGVWS